MNDGNNQMSTGTSAIGVLFIILVIWLLVGRGLGGVANGYDNVCGCNRVSNCEVEKQTILNTASTQNLIQSEAAATRSQATSLYIQGQAEKMFDLKMDAQTNLILQGQALAAKDAEIASLKAQMYTDARFAVLERGQEKIECHMLKRPEVFGQGYVTTATPVPTFNSGCGCF